MEDTKIKKSYTEEEAKKYQQCQPIIVYFKEGVKENEIFAFTEGFKKIYGVYEVTYLSREEAVKRYKELHKNEPLLIEIMPKGLPFPASAEIYVSDPNLKNSILGTAKNQSIVDMAN